MTETTTEVTVSNKNSRVLFFSSLLLSIALAAATFWAAYTNRVLGPELSSKFGKSEGILSGHDSALPAQIPSFVELEPIVVSLGTANKTRHLRFRAHVEVGNENGDVVVALMPRILDVLNGYLRAVDIPELERPSSLIRLRAQMLRRVQLVAGESNVRDLLITEFVLN
ncbi:flagellar basal body-associated FliL family protein [Aliiruegeria haliotis]|nr:flagellar basal body-associated FliL family protein [Aliiruegeria haliotis]